MKNGRSTAIIGILIVLVLIFWGAWVVFRGAEEERLPDVSTENWQEYTDPQFNFSIQYPPTWRIASSSEPFAPKITFYKPDVLTAMPPFDHFANATHVSVYPRGIPTEGEFADRRDASVTLGESVADGKDLILEEGTVFASSYWFTDPPATWEEAGFVWAKIRIDDASTTCLRDGEEISQSLCDPLTGDRIVWQGTVSAEDRAVEEAMLKSFRFVDEASEAKDDLIVVESPEENVVIESPLTIRGEARGQWFFEASFPVKLLDADGKIIKQGSIETTEEWMTTDFVPFESVLTFTPPKTTTGTLVLERSNPSGLPENADEIRISVRFK